MSDRAELSQVPTRASLDFPACARAGGQTVRILCDFSGYKMLYCAENQPRPAGGAGHGGNGLNRRS
jgi:hypothetical protein